MLRIFTNHRTSFNFSKLFIKNSSIYFSIFKKKNDRTISGDLSQLLDSNVITSATNNSNNGNGIRNSKMIKSLKLKEKQVLDIRSQGSLESTCEDLMDNMNEVLDSNKLNGLFKGVNNVSNIIEIVEVTINKDYSHATGLWKSELIESFLKSVEEKHGVEEYLYLKEKMQNKITKKLQLKEPLFRTNIMNKMSFRRVPRIFFKECEEGKLPQLDQRDRQSLLMNNSNDGNNNSINNNSNNNILLNKKS